MNKKKTNPWILRKLFEICQIEAGRRPSKKELSETDYFSLGGEHITEDHRVNYEKNDWFITEEFWHCLKKGKLDEEATLLVKDGATIGKCAYFKPQKSKYMASVNEHVYKITSKANICNNKFLYYVICSPVCQSQIMNCITGAAQPGLNRSFLKSVEISLPDYRIQKRISSILSAYDDLIENNTRRIQILEEMAQRIYREWFVDFRFPGCEKVKFVDSELGKIPEGWEVLQLGEVLESIESGSRPKGGIDPEERGVPSIGAENVLGLGRYDFGKEKYVSEDFYESMGKGKIKSGDILLYKDGAKIGRKSMFRDGFPHEVCCINEHVFILRTNSKCSQNYLYFYLDRPDITEKIINLNANAAQPGINQAGVKNLPILLPPENLIRLFDEKVDSIIGMLFNLAKKNQILRKKRDLLLPKLISGELDVSNLDIALRNTNEEK